MTFSLRSIFLLAVVTLILDACAAPQEATVEQKPQVKPEIQAPTPKDDLANLPRVTMLPPERAMRDGLQGPAAPGPERLIGLVGNEIQKMLGLPDFKRRDPPAEIWQYRKDGCLLDIFLYQDKNDASTHRVTHVEARGHSVNQVSGTECLLEALAR